MKKTHFRKKSIFFLLAVLSITISGFTFPVRAFDMQACEVSQDQLRAIGVARLNCLLDISTSGIAQCYGEVAMKADYNSKFTLYLQRSKDGQTWSNITSWNSNGTSVLAKIHNVTHGYAYQCMLSINVYDASGKYIVTHTEYSPTVFY